MKHYIIETQETPEAPKRPVTMQGKVRIFASSSIAVRMARFVKMEFPGHIVHVVSREQQGPQEVIQI